ncbi:MAG: hypothetical protein QOH73_1764 [Gaiellaceae bacterium]|jgi:predicted DNA repair protein MutK|nr:hypothetical protein [Gaiellaceae bacterium]
MAVIRYYRLFSLFALVIAVLALFVGFFLVWVIIPVAAIGFLYLGFGLGGGVSSLPLTVQAREERRERLASEAQARKRGLERERQQGDLPA